ncbi:MAG: hypothetical protein ACOYIB_03610 [Desulfosporosinus sp.]
MPSNYIPWSGPGPIDKQHECFQAAGIKLAIIAGKVRARVKIR